MEVYICSVKAKIQAGNIWFKDIKTTQIGQSRKKSASDLKNLAEGLGSMRERCRVYVFMRVHLKYCPNFILKGSRKGTVEHNSHIVKAGVGATC